MVKAAVVAALAALASYSAVANRSLFIPCRLFSTLRASLLIVLLLIYSSNFSLSVCVCCMMCNMCILNRVYDRNEFDDLWHSGERLPFQWPRTYNINVLGTQVSRKRKRAQFKLADEYTVRGTQHTTDLSLSFPRRM